MRVAIAVIGLLILVLGVLGVARPRILIGLVGRVWATRVGLFAALAIRAAFGILLIAAATSTRFPWTIGVIGVVSLLAAVSLPVLGYQRLRKFVDWWAGRSGGFVRAWSLLACVFGAFLIYAAV